jgi:hypothetical protein
MFLNYPCDTVRNLHNITFAWWSRLSDILAASAADPGSLHVACMSDASGQRRVLHLSALSSQRFPQTDCTANGVPETRRSSFASSHAYECLRTRCLVTKSFRLMVMAHASPSAFDRSGPKSIRRTHATPPVDADFGCLRSECPGAGRRSFRSVETRGFIKLSSWRMISGRPRDDR